MYQNVLQHYCVLNRSIAHDVSLCIPGLLGSFERIFLLVRVHGATLWSFDERGRCCNLPHIHCLRANHSRLADTHFQQLSDKHVLTVYMATSA